MSSFTLPEMSAQYWAFISLSIDEKTDPLKIEKNNISGLYLNIDTVSLQTLQDICPIIGMAPNNRRKFWKEN
jgi:hypothetical protein